jgi:ethanolamine ammonia-lyase small subunit
MGGFFRRAQRIPFSRVDAVEKKGVRAAQEILPQGERDPWFQLGAHTSARIALGRAGGSLRTNSLIELRIAHAAARDAVDEPFDPDGLAVSLRERGIASEIVASAAPDRRTYLARPDLGRQLSPESTERLRAIGASAGSRDLVILVSDGLSALAAHGHAAETVTELDRILRAAGWTLHPIYIIPLARVKIQDAVGEILRARHSLILLGERPGLSAQDSLGAYLTFEPRADRTDADRNCVSNIRQGGLPPLEAASKIARILQESRRLSLSGTALREN